MKKIAPRFIAIMLGLLLLAACGGNGTAENGAGHAENAGKSNYGPIQTARNNAGGDTGCL